MGTGRTAVAWIALLSVGACSGSAKHASTAGEGEDRPDSGVVEHEDSARAEPLGRAPTVAALPGDFPHDPHREVACSTCHRSPRGHTSHADIECVECHLVPESFQTATALSDRECMACHHGEDQKVGCTECHDDVRAMRAEVTQVVRVAGAEPGRERRLLFEHERHGEPDCRDCHRTPLTYARDRSCATCHEPHHQEEAECMTCHSGPFEGAHDLTAHRGCGAEGCHTDPVVNALPLGRTVCLACHQEQAEHEPGEACGSCHATVAGSSGSQAGKGGR